MKFNKTTKKVLSLSLAAAVTAGSVVAPGMGKKTDAAASYKAYLCFMSKSYKGCLNQGSDRSKKVHNNGKSYSGITIKDATFKKGNFTFTVSVTGKNLAKFKSDKGWNTIYVDTNLPGTSKSKFSVSKAVLKMDGKVVKTIKNPVVTPEKGKKQDTTQPQIVNCWNTACEKKCKAASITKMPTKSMSVTITGKLK